MTCYVAHRLFAAHDRALAAELANRLAAEIGADNVFLPFCDTDEESLVAEVKGRRLYELDRHRLSDISAMVAVLHGPSLDDGVCMEIGFAAARGAHVTVLTTDFQTYSLTESGPHLDFPDPLVQVLADSVVRVPRLGRLPAVPQAGATRFALYCGRNVAQIDTALAAAVDASVSAPGFRGQQGPDADGTVYIEVSPYGADRREALIQACRTTGLRPVLPRRFTAADPIGAARDDLAAALRASRVLVDVSGPEAPPGAALLVGAATSVGGRVACLARNPTFTHAAGREPNWRNLMIQYAAEARLSSSADVRGWLRS